MSDSEIELKREIEAICHEFDARWATEGRTAIESLLDRVDAGLHQELLEQLLAIDVKLRLKGEESFDAGDYQSFGDQAVSYVEQLLKTGSPTRSMANENATQDFNGQLDDSDDSLAPDSVLPEAEPPTSVGRYQIESVLGKGGFGLVYKAYDDQLKRFVAVKVPYTHLVKRAADAEAYLYEARTVANLEHPNIVPVHDVGQNDEFPCFVVSRFIEGTDLSERIKQKPLSVGESVELVATIAGALHYAHKQGLVHRDVKPGNILLGLDGKPYLVDFGLALKEQKVGTGVEYAGTPAYMSPEQARGEGHRVDGRSDIYSLGVVFYELLVGQRPFRADSTPELLKKVASLDVRPPRQINDTVPRELERICLKSLSRRASDRYTTAMDLADDLRHFLQVESAESLTETGVLRGTSQDADSTRAGIESETPHFDSDSREIRVVPKGLRSFDAHDADFFLELLPGPRDRDGLPESIRFWKTKIEETDPDHTFSIGLIYGPSGCGKSSLVKAGLLPRLSKEIISFYVEATPDETEDWLLRGFRRKMPEPYHGLNLVELVTALRRGTGRVASQKVLIVIDQFEQWLNANRDHENSELVRALRQCDGNNVQCILMVRDDFWMAVSRFFDQIEVDLVKGKNFAAVELFDEKHARKVLKLLGAAYGSLGESSEADNNRQFIDKVVTELSDDGNLICVHLALFAEMVKGKPWTLETFTAIGGTQGVGVKYLDGIFESKSAMPKHRLYSEPARKVLDALLPEIGTDIKVYLRSYDVLCEASGCKDDVAFDEVLAILEKETRLVSPVDTAGVPFSYSLMTFDSGVRAYQLTHDYLVPSIRDWLTRKQRETRRGRAELLLAERSATWNSKPENRHLPSTLEWLRIHGLSARANWTAAQRKMMRRANRVKGVFWTAMLALIALSGFGIQQTLSRIEQRTAQRNTQVAVDSLQGAEGKAVPYALENLGELPPELVVDQLKGRFSEATDQQKLSLSYGLARYEQADIQTIVTGLINDGTDPEEVRNIVAAMRNNPSESLEKIKVAAENASIQKNWSTKARLAIVSLHLGDESLAAEMLRDQPEKTKLAVELPDLLANFRLQANQIASLPDAQRNSAESRLKLGVANYFLDLNDEALVELERLTDGDSANWEVWLRQAICQARVGREKDAKESLQRLAKSTRTQSLIAYGEILVQAWLGDMESANKQLDGLITAESESALAQYNAACIAAQLVRVCRANQLPEENQYRQQALHLLRKAYVSLGYDDSGTGLNNDPDFIPLHQDQGFLDLVSELKPPAQSWDPIQRTVFIGEFAQWSGSLEPLSPLLANSDKPALRSGICLGIGGIERPGQAAKDAWQPILQDWNKRAIDSGTHSAAGWALSQWKMDVPDIEETKQPSGGRDWWHASGIRFARIRAGSVRGSQSDDEPIVIADDFWLSDCEITVGLFKQFMADEEYHRQHPGMKPVHWAGAYDFNNDDSPDLPVQQVSWFDAVMFCNWLSWQLDLEPCYEINKSKPPERDADQPQDQDGGRAEENVLYEVIWHRVANGIRLPTEGEWEYACRAQTTTLFNSGDDEFGLMDYGWYGLNSNWRTHLIRTKRCNAWGLFDMHGNVSEWCWDDVGSNRVHRGGSWSLSAGDCLSSFRRRFTPSLRSLILGFRVARGPSSQASKTSK